MAKFLDEHVSLEELCTRIHCSQDEAIKAADDMINGDIFIADEKGEAWVTRRDGFQIVVALHLKKAARFTVTQIKSALAEHDLTLENPRPIVKLIDDGFLVIKLRLKDLRARYITLLER